ncbi:sel1 repeat family protein [Aliarcobacter cryaerophilus]|uniref:tetratricopeptide repeat protein n=1 Tax=Aliarcobacter cryaerophilus TaxID=28198 RepID=UPI0021B5CD95|nr:tetratricopeptide repeat protein [Aliarcobacter cryaerophilus]MCT7525479.1 sel1 repeat family protein [Aliarcobacter cryaerophilus]
MKKILVSLGLALTISFGTTLDEGVVAYKKGDYKAGLVIFEDLASKNDAIAQYYLGIMYDNGFGVKQDYLKAKEWYEKVAAKGMPKAHYNLGIMYYNGFGVKQNYLKSKEWFIKACNGGFKPGCKIINKELKQLGY